VIHPSSEIDVSTLGSGQRRLLRHFDEGMNSRVKKSDTIEMGLGQGD
jgi:hypothetical protein